MGNERPPQDQSPKGYADITIRRSTERGYRGYLIRISLLILIPCSLSAIRQNFISPTTGSPNNPSASEVAKLQERSQELIRSCKIVQNALIEKYAEARPALDRDRIFGSFINLWDWINLEPNKSESQLIININEQLYNLINQINSQLAESDLSEEDRATLNTILLDLQLLQGLHPDQLSKLTIIAQNEIKTLVNQVNETGVCTGESIAIEIEKMVLQLGENGFKGFLEVPLMAIAILLVLGLIISVVKHPILAGISSVFKKK